MTAEDFLKAVLPTSARHWLRRQPLRVWRLLCGDASFFRRTTPVDVHWGGKRGTIVDRYYVEQFLARHAEDVRGHVLEFGSDSYTRKFGGDKVTNVDVLDLGVENPGASIIADLNHADWLPSDTFDCIVCTQVLPLIYDLRAAIRTLYRILKPGGILLLTSPGIQKISRGDMEIGGDYWRFTTLSMRRLFEEVFPSDSIEIEASGNVLAAVAFLHGLAVEDLRRKDLEHRDPDFLVSIAMRAVRHRSSHELCN
jgi:SAM-dependent methyltransferase